MTLQEVAMYCGVQVRTVREWVSSGKIKATKNESGYRWVVSQEEADRMLEKRHANKN